MASTCSRETRRPLSRSKTPQMPHISLVPFPDRNPVFRVLELNLLAVQPNRRRRSKCQREWPHWLHEDLKRVALTNQVEGLELSTAAKLWRSLQVQPRTFD